MSIKEMMRVVEAINKHAVSLTTAGIALNSASVELMVAYNEHLHLEDPVKYTKLIREFSAALSATLDCLDKLVDESERLLDEQQT